MHGACFAWLINYAQLPTCTSSVVTMASFDDGAESSNSVTCQS